MREPGSKALFCGGWIWTPVIAVDPEVSVFQSALLRGVDLDEKPRRQDCGPRLKVFQSALLRGVDLDRTPRLAPTGSSFKALYCAGWIWTTSSSSAAGATFQSALLRGVDLDLNDLKQNHAPQVFQSALLRGVDLDKVTNIYKNVAIDVSKRSLRGVDLDVIPVPHKEGITCPSFKALFCAGWIWTAARSRGSTKDKFQSALLRGVDLDVYEKKGS